MMTLTEPELFTVAKTIHVTTVSITITGFIVRGIWMMRKSALLKSKPAKVFPHINDTVLLGSALWTGYLSGQYPFVNGWLTAKILGAIAYIVLGAIALTYGHTQRTKLTAFAGAIICFGYVVCVAVTKNPLLI